MKNYKNVIFGCAGLELTAKEKLFFLEQQPVGYILFARNCDNPEQLLRLTNSLRAIADNDNIMVLIDQEGGRVARLRSPHWRDVPSAESLSSCYDGNPKISKRLIYLNGLLIARELQSVGINVDCAPLADVPSAECHNIIGDRAYGDNAERITDLAAEMARGLKDGGVLPIIKHIPGHGRATVDSHEELPTVNAALSELQNSDFVPFKKLNYISLGMTAHVKYSAIDPDNVATLSKAAIDIIRNEIGFDGILMTDDMSMKALKGDLFNLTEQALSAGCDLILHCNGKMDEMQDIAAACEIISGKPAERMTRVWGELDACSKAEYKGSYAEIEKEFNELLGE